MRLLFVFCFLALTDADILREEGKKFTGNFPFRLLDESRLEGGGVEVVGEAEDEAVVVAEEEGDVRCVEKVMMVEETEWEEVVNCEVSHQQRCHPTYVTR